jgi:hypothetical protein
MTEQSTKDRATGAAASATEGARQVGQAATEEARNVASTAAEQARTVAGDTITQLRDQANEQAAGQRDRLVATLGSFGDDLSRMADQAPDGGMATDLARAAARRARDLRDRIDGRQPSELLDDLRDFARRRPGTFLLGALTAGVVAGRLFRATADGAAAASLAPTPGPDREAGAVLVSGSPTTGVDDVPPPAPESTSPPPVTTTPAPGGVAPLTGEDPRSMEAS